MDRVLFAGTGSGTGKTTIVCGFLNEMVKRRFNVVSFKCGPDYIDPMFHRQVLDVPGYNLDSFFLEKDRLLKHFREKCGGKDLAVLEGAMGYYDGAGFTEKGSAYEIASLTDTPVVLIVNAKGTGNSVCAIVKGFLAYRNDHHIRGVILNRVTERTYLGVKRELEEMGVVPCGFVSELNDDLIFENRHLGLDFANSGKNLKEKISRLGEAVCKTLEVDKILEIAKEAADFPLDGNLLRGRKGVKGSEISVAVAYDEAFSFLYEENMELLRRYGIRPVFFSPLRDKTLPKDCKGLLLPGGYPESHAGKLSENKAIRCGIKQAVLGGMPVIAECGGYMYLKESMEGTDGGIYPMTGVLRGTARKKEHPVRFGYVTLLAQKDNMLCKAGERIRAHEFHYWDCEENGDAFTAVPAGNKEAYPCIFAEGNLFAGYPHLYLLSNENVVKNFRKRCEEYIK